MTAPATPDAPEARTTRWHRSYLIGLVVGGATIGWGLAGLLRHASQTVPASWTRWLVGSLLVHDLLLAPAALLAARLLGRLPPRWRGPVRAAAFVSAVVLLFSVPALLGIGRRTQSGNASVLPNDHPLSVALVLAAVWAVALGAAALRGWSGRRRRRSA